MQVILYSQDNGTVAVVRPTNEALALHGIEAIALKDVPEGKPFKIINASEVPADRAFRDAWTVSAEDLTDGVGAAWNVFPEDGE
jgi:hypothetical protein